VCIDAGDTSTVYNDHGDAMNPGEAEWSSLGGVRNDMGCYGGPGRTLLSGFPTGVQDKPMVIHDHSRVFKNEPNPFSDKTVITLSTDYGVHAGALKIYDIMGRLVCTVPMSQSSHSPLTHITWAGIEHHGHPVRPGIYVCLLQMGNTTVNKKMIRAR
jgi:hypothetical protein